MSLVVQSIIWVTLDENKHQLKSEENISTLKDRCGDEKEESGLFLLQEHQISCSRADDELFSTRY